jgi:Carbohydrate-selective porin, OprB family
MERGKHWNSKARAESGAEMVLEFTYMAILTRWLYFQPDAQLIINPAALRISKTPLSSAGVCRSTSKALNALFQNAQRRLYWAQERIVLPAKSPATYEET